MPIVQVKKNRAQSCWETCQAENRHRWDLNFSSAMLFAATGLCSAGSFRAALPSRGSGQWPLSLFITDVPGVPTPPPPTPGHIFRVCWCYSSRPAVKWHLWGFFPFEVRMFAHFTLKQGKKQELKQINNRSLGERAWRARMQSPLCHIQSSNTERSLSPSKWLSLLIPFLHFWSFYLQRNWLVALSLSLSLLYLPHIFFGVGGHASHPVLRLLAIWPQGSNNFSESQFPPL